MLQLLLGPCPIVDFLMNSSGCASAEQLPPHLPHCVNGSSASRVLASTQLESSSYLLDIRTGDGQDSFAEDAPNNLSNSDGSYTRALVQCNQSGGSKRCQSNWVDKVLANTSNHHGYGFTDQLTLFGMMTIDVSTQMHQCQMARQLLEFSGLLNGSIDHRSA